jgi:hypothetical protein
MSMKKLTLKKNINDPYGSDIDRMRDVMRTAGYDVSRTDCSLAWDAYSDSMCAGWMSLPESDETLAYILKQYLEDES